MQLLFFLKKRLVDTYVKIGRVLDLTSSFTSSSTEINDKSPENNDATLYTGRYTNFVGGSEEYALFTSPTAFNATPAKVRGYFRSASDGTYPIDWGGTDIVLTFTANNTWQQVEASSGSLSASPSSISFGYDGASDYYTGDAAYLEILDASNNVLDIIGFGDRVATYADGDLCLSNNGRTGAYQATPVGGTGETTIPQSAGMDWNRYFVSAAIDPYLWDSLTWDPSTLTVAGENASGAVAGGLDIPNGTTGAIVTVSGNIQITGGSPSVSLRPASNDVTIRSNVVSLTESGDFEATLTATGDYAALSFGEGDPNSDWEITGLKIVLPSGNMLIPASLSDNTVDVLGNEIANPRPSTDTINLFGDGEYAVVADNDSLDMTTEATWELWINPYGDYGTDKDFFSKYDTSDVSNSSWIIYQNDTESDSELTFLYVVGFTPVTYKATGITDEFSHIIWTFNNGTLRCWQNAEEKTVSKVFGPDSTTLKVGTSNIHVGANFDGTTTSRFAERQISRPKIYNRALTADQVLQNYNAQKSQFGL